MIPDQIHENRGGTLKVYSWFQKSTWGHGDSYDEGRNHHLEDLKSLEVAGFSYRGDLSQEKEWVFIERINKNIPEKRQELFFDLLDKEECTMKTPKWILESEEMESWAVGLGDMFEFVPEFCQLSLLYRHYQ